LSNEAFFEFFSSKMAVKIEANKKPSKENIKAP